MSCFNSALGTAPLGVQGLRRDGLGIGPISGEAVAIGNQLHVTRKV
jgi:hypothetical protein